LKIFSFTNSSNSFTKNVLKIVTGSALAHFIALLVMPIITRLFEPEVFGSFAVFSSMIGIISVVSCFRYHVAIMLPESNCEASNILCLSFLSAILMTFIVGLIVCLFGVEIIKLLNVAQLKNYLWLIPLAILFQGVFLALNYWNSRTKHFGRLSVANVISSLITQTTKLIAGLAGLVSTGVFIVASLLGSIVATSILGGLIWKDNKKFFLSNIRWKAICQNCIRFKKFPLVESWGALLNSISWQLPAFMLAYFFSSTVVGFYALGLTVVKSPLGLIGSALSQVFFQKASEERTIKGNNAETVEKLMDNLMFVGILPAVILAMVGEELFMVVFGSRWADAGIYAQILAPWLICWFISVPLGSLFAVYERQGTDLFVNSIIFITRVISLYIGGIYQNIYLALGLFSVTGIAVYGIMALFNIRFSKANTRKILLNLLKYILHSLPICVLLVAIKYLFEFNPIVILLFASTILILYYFIFRNKLYSIIKTRN